MVRNILIAADLFQKGISDEVIYKRRIEPVLIELSSGQQVDPSVIGPDFSLENFDIKQFTDDPRLSVAIAPKDDIAKINRRPKYMLVYIAKTAGRPDMLVLPVYGKGLWSTIYGLLAKQVAWQAGARRQRPSDHRRDKRPGRSDCNRRLSSNRWASRRHANQQRRRQSIALLVGGSGIRPFVGKIAAA